MGSSIKFSWISGFLLLFMRLTSPGAGKNLSIIRKCQGKFFQTNRNLLRISVLPVFLGVLLFESNLTYAQTHTTIANGNWTNAAIWSGGVPPSSLASTRIVNINHTVNYDLSSDISNSGTIRIEAVSGTTANLILPSGRNIDNNETGKIYIINAKLTQFRFLTGGNSGTPQSGNFNNKGGYINCLTALLNLDRM